MANIKCINMPNPEMRSMPPTEEKTTRFEDEPTKVAQPEMVPADERAKGSEKTEVDYEMAGRVKMVREFADKRDQALSELKKLETNPVSIAPEGLEEERAKWKKIADAYDEMVGEALDVFGSTFEYLDPQTKAELTQLHEITQIPSEKTQANESTTVEEFDNELTVETVGPTEMIYLMKKQFDNLQASNLPEAQKLEKLQTLSDHAHHNIETITSQHQDEVLTDPKSEKEFADKIENLRNFIRTLDQAKQNITGEEPKLDKMAAELKKDVEESKTPIQKPFEGSVPGVVKRETAEPTPELSPEDWEKMRVDVDIMKAELVTLYTDRSIPKEDFTGRLNSVREKIGTYLNQISGELDYDNEVAVNLVKDLSSMYSSTTTEFGRESWIRYQPGLAEADIRFDDMATATSEEVTKVDEPFRTTEDIPFANPEDVIALDEDTAEKTVIEEVTKIGGEPEASKEQTQVEPNPLTELTGEEEKTQVDQPKAA